MSYDNLVIVLPVAAGVPFLLALVPRVPLPGPVLEIVAGVVLGPAVLNVVQPDATVQALSITGLSFLLFLAGLEIDFKQLRGPRARLVGTGLAGTLALAAALGWTLHIAGLFGARCSSAPRWWPRLWDFWSRSSRTPARSTGRLAS
ncbi:cation:proton antiporter [Streptomyces sp. NPDC001137]|uniref:cation:proton antiporter domain-containing protein n=1 Tax=Streptomyces sp. NPDC001137 TaxID=3154378 RepID=UPI003316F169